MTVTVHGVPGQVGQTAAEAFGQAARSGAFWETVTARALERWLAEPTEYHVFHSLRGLNNISGHGFGPMSLGVGDIDHVILNSKAWVAVNAKRLPAGVLGTDPEGHGILVTPGNKSIPITWLDQITEVKAAAILYRLTALAGLHLWVIPDTVLFHSSITRARCMQNERLGLVMRIGDLPQAPRWMPEPFGGPPASPEQVTILSRYVRNS